MNCQMQPCVYAFLSACLKRCVYSIRAHLVMLSNCKLAVFAIMLLSSLSHVIFIDKWGTDGNSQIQAEWFVIHHQVNAGYSIRLLIYCRIEPIGLDSSVAEFTCYAKSSFALALVWINHNGLVQIWHGCKCANVSWLSYSLFYKLK